VKKMLITVSLFLVSSTAFAVKKQIKVEIVAPSEDRSVKTQGTGLIGAIAGTRTTEVVFMVNAQIDGDHARLK